MGVKSRRVGLILWTLLILLDDCIDGHEESNRRRRFSEGVVAKSVIEC